MALNYLLGSSTGGSTASTTGAWKSYPAKDHGGESTVYCWGTFGNSVASVQVRPQGSTSSFAVTSSTFTADGYLKISLEAHQIRGVTSASTVVAAIRMAIQDG